MCQAEAARPAASPENSGNFQVTAFPILQAGDAVIANKNGEISDDRAATPTTGSAVLPQRKGGHRVLRLPLRATERLLVERHAPLAAQLRLIKVPIRSAGHTRHSDALAST